MDVCVVDIGHLPTSRAARVAVFFGDPAVKRAGLSHSGRAATGLDARSNS